MKPSAAGHSYAIRCTVDQFKALPDETGPDVGACSKSAVVDVLVVRRREKIDGGTCITHYPVILTDAEGEPLDQNP